MVYDLVPFLSVVNLDLLDRILFEDLDTFSLFRQCVMLTVPTMSRCRRFLCTTEVEITADEEVQWPDQFRMLRAGSHIGELVRFLVSSVC